MAWHMGEILAVVAFREAAVFDGAGVGTQDNGFLKRLKDSDTSHSPSRPSVGQLPSLDSAHHELSSCFLACPVCGGASSPPPPASPACSPASLSSQKRLLLTRLWCLRQRLHAIHLLPRDKATHPSKFAPVGLFLLLHQKKAL